MKGQNKIHSFFEAVANVVIGYGVALLSQILIFPIFEIKVSLNQNISIGLIFTGISLLRSYLLRRFFNWWQTTKK